MSDSKNHTYEKKNVRHINIPIFIPHLGCPNDCVFCNQRIISGHLKFNAADIDSEITRALSTIESDAETELAFFGGSFTGIPREEMTALLDTAQKYADSGKISAIRLSTRPDYIDDEILEILRGYSVKTIELGLQSLSDTVLCASKRGHSRRQAENACHLVKEYGFSLIGQMMTGLPLSELSDEIMTAHEICAFGADGARIYPTVVLRGTALHSMMIKNEYTPSDIDDAVVRAGEALSVFAEHSVPVIRIGLCATDTLSDGGDVVGGAYHPALGEMVKGYVYLKRIRALLERYDREYLADKSLLINVPRGAASAVIGQRRKNKIFISGEYNVKNIKVIENNDFSEYNISIEILDVSQN